VTVCVRALTSRETSFSNAAKHPAPNASSTENLRYGRLAAVISAQR